MVNGAMEFDMTTLTPGYRLTIGEPGQSHALDIARRCGMPERLLAAAGKFAGTIESEFHALLAELKELRQKSEFLLRETRQRELAVRQKEEQVAGALREIEQLRRDAREKGLQAAKELVNDTRAELNRILAEARTTGKRTVSQAVAAVEGKLDAGLDALRPQQRLAPDGIIPGATVFVKALGHDATVIAVEQKQQRLRLSAGSIEIEVPFAAVSTPSGDKQVASRLRTAAKTGRSDEPAHELNLLGCRVEEALVMLEKFIDASTLYGLREVRIIHGLGTGALMRSVREQLSRSTQVASWRIGESFEGGAGVTVAILQN
jgi:DNA mismatch repair protein MutS2